MHLPPVTFSPAPLAAPFVVEAGVPVGLMLLGVRVTASAILRIAGHQHRRQLLPAEKPEGLTRDGWSWLLEEKTYRRWLTRRAGNHDQESPARATDGASEARAS